MYYEPESDFMQLRHRPMLSLSSCLACVSSSGKAIGPKPATEGDGQGQLKTPLTEKSPANEPERRKDLRRGAATDSEEASDSIGWSRFDESVRMRIAGEKSVHNPAALVRLTRNLSRRRW